MAAPSMAAPRVLPVFGESSLDYQLRRFGEIWEDLNPGGTMEARLAIFLADPIYGATFAIGFVEGFMDGGGNRLRVWRDELDATFKALVKLAKDDNLVVIPVGIGVGLYEFFWRKFEPETPVGLAPETVEVLERLKVIHEFGPVFMMLGLLNEKFKTRSLLESLNLIAEDIAAALVETSGNWVRSFLLATGDADKQGQMLGRFIGEAFVELVRAFVEPPALDMAQLITVFGLVNDEARALTGAATP
jgi:hypothetical protein